MKTVSAKELAEKFVNFVTEVFMTPEGCANPEVDAELIRLEDSGAIVEARKSKKTAVDELVSDLLSCSAESRRKLFLQTDQTTLALIYDRIQCGTHAMMQTAQQNMQLQSKEIPPIQIFARSLLIQEFHSSKTSLSKDKKPKLIEENSRLFSVETMKPEDLTWFFPNEIIGRLEAIARDCGIDLNKAKGKPVPENQKLNAIDSIVNGFILPTLNNSKQLLPENYAHLPKKIQNHFVYLLQTSRNVACELSKTQPDTPLGVPRGPQGVLSNLLSASWIDLTEGGKVKVMFEPMNKS